MSSDAQEPAKKPQSKTFHHQYLKNGTKLYLNTKTADVHFKFDADGDDGAGKRIPAHKNLLAAESDVFEAMFYGGLKENGDIQVIDASDAAFMEFLQYFYLSKFNLTAKHVVDVLHLGHKYNVAQCIDDCMTFLVETMDNENVCTILQRAVLYDQTELLKMCEKHIIINTAAVFQSANFLECDQKILAHILKMNLFSCSEVEVFQACMAWIKAKSKQTISINKAMDKKYLGNLYNEIRFASMTIDIYAH